MADLEDEKKDDKLQDDAAFEFELSDDAVSDVEEAVLKANAGKAKDELADEIEAAKVERLSEMKKDNEAVIAKLNEFSKDPENEGKSESELMEMAQKAVVDGADDDDSDDYLGDDFFGKGSKNGVAPSGGDTGGDKNSDTELPSDVRAELDEYRKMKEDEGFKAYVEAKKSGEVDFIGMVTESGLAFNAKNLSPEQLKQYELNQLQQADPSITDEEIADEMDDFNDKSKIEKAKAVLSIRADIEKQQKEGLKAFSTKISSNAIESKEELTKVVTEAETALKNDYLGNTFFGVKVDNERTAKVLKNIRSKGVSSKKADGTPNISEAIEKELLWENRYEIIEAAQQRMSKNMKRMFALKQGKPLGLKARSSASRKSPVDSRKALAAAQKEAGMI